MSLGTDLAAAVGLIQADAALLRAIVQGPVSGGTSIVTIPATGQQVKTLSRTASEVPGGHLPLTGGTLSGALTVNGNLGVSADGSVTIGGRFASFITVIPALQTNGATASGSYASVTRWSNDSTSPSLILGKSRGASLGAQAIVSASDSLGTLVFAGSDGVAQYASGYIRGMVDGTPGVGDMPGRISILTSAAGTTTPAERVRVSNGGAVALIGIGTTASAANMFHDSGSSPVGNVLRSTSSLDYKTDVEDLDSAIADKLVREARPIFYKSLAPADNPAWTWYGLGAEEVAEIDPRLVTWGYKDSDFETVMVPVEREVPAEGLVDADGNQLLKSITVEEPERRLKAGAVKSPDGVGYDRLTVMLLDVVRRQGEEIAALGARIAALEEA